MARLMISMPPSRTICLGSLLALALLPLYLHAYYLSFTYSVSASYAVDEARVWHEYQSNDFSMPDGRPPSGNPREDPVHGSLFHGQNRPSDDPSPQAKFPSSKLWEILQKEEQGESKQQNAVSKAFLSMAVFMVAMLEWTRPGSRHWPPYEVYMDSRYDPNRWEGFDRENRYYLASVTQKLPKKSRNDPKPYLPFPDYNGDTWRSVWKGEFALCQGPRGVSLDNSPSDQVYAYRRPSRQFPNPSIGTLENLGIPSNVCFDRQSRYGSYGLSERSPENVVPSREVADWDRVDWGNLQDKCLLRNKNRYYPRGWKTLRLRPGIEIPNDFSEPTPDEETVRGSIHREQKYHPRTAVLIRSWEGYEYTENDILAIRALITELSLFPGGEYTVFLLVQIKSKDQYDIYNSRDDYERALKDHIPSELQSITVLWTEDMCEKAYPEVGNWNVYFQQWMPVQWFAATHPEFDFFWNWETDIRYTGHHYEFLEKLAKFARNQRRRFLWERNKRYWIPSVHGNFDKWYSDTNAKIEAAARDGQIPPPVWGPQPYHPDQQPLGPEAPSPDGTFANAWGSGEEADLITLLPIWDPRKTDWSYRNQIWNFVKGVAPKPDHLDIDMGFDHPKFKNIPRRASISTVARVSRPLLRAMHIENQAGRSMQAEMWPTTVALHHGFKAVYAPHPIWWDRKWPALYADAVFNAHTDDDYDGHDVPAGVFPDLTKQETDGDNGIHDQTAKTEGLRSGERLTTHWKRGVEEKPEGHSEVKVNGNDGQDDDGDASDSGHSRSVFGGFAFLRNAVKASTSDDDADSTVDQIAARPPSVETGDSRVSDRYRDTYASRHRGTLGDPNAGAMHPVQWGERSDSPYNHDREWNFAGWSWYYRSSFGGTLYRRFLGLRTPEVHDTGEAFETMPADALPPGRLGEPDKVLGGEEWEQRHGRICLPAMLLHPIKKAVEIRDPANQEGHAIEDTPPSRIKENPIPQWRR